MPWVAASLAHVDYPRVQTGDGRGCFGCWQQAPDPARVDTDRHACLKSAPRQVLGKPVTRDLRAIPALPPQR